MQVPDVSKSAPSVRTVAAWLIPFLWSLILIAPAATAFSSLNDWDVDPSQLLVTSCWLVLCARALLSAPAYYLLSYPLALLGLICVFAHTTRHVDLLELAAYASTFSSAEWHDSLAPYYKQMAAGAIGLAVIAAVGIHLDKRKPANRFHWLICAISGFALLVSVPNAVWIRAWPANALAAGISMATGSDTLTATLFPNSSIANPRVGKKAWDAFRDAAPPESETYVLVIGESIRSDYLRECGGPARLRALNQNALIACNVTAGSNATHTSVPLLISRDMPGTTSRVPRDATFASAFSSLGFETYWLSMHDASLAWADTLHQSYLGTTGLDSALLLPALETVLTDSATRRLIVLHAYNAHAPYCQRSNHSASPPYPVDCRALDRMAPGLRLNDWRFSYTNAVDESVAFLNRLIERLDQLPGRVFLVYTPDHAENLGDDARQLYQHALRHPSRWDIQVPAVFWANTAWQQQQPQKWQVLKGNLNSAMMHADIVPTLLSAAGISYSDPRTNALDLLVHTIPPVRKRPVQRALGATIDWDTLVEEAK